MNRRVSFGILLVLLVSGFLLRWHQLGAHGIAGDEKYSLFVSQFVSWEGNNQRNSVRNPDTPYFTPEQFWSPKGTADFFDSIARIDTGNGAFYTYLLHYWTLLFGLSDASLRFLPMLFSVLTIGLLYVFVRRHFGTPNAPAEGLALLAAFLCTISPFNIAYAQIARNYAINFFFALLATDLLLRIIDAAKAGRYPTFHYVAYGLCVLICELCHIATFSLFVIHGLFVLCYVRPGRVWVGLLLAMLIPAAGVGAWLTVGGGQWLFDYVSNSTRTYTQMATEHPDDYLSLTSPRTVVRQIRHVVSCLFLPFEGLYEVLGGARNGALCVGTIVGSIAAYRFVRADRLRAGLILGLFAVALALYSTHRLQFTILSAGLLLLLIQAHALWTLPATTVKRNSVFMALLTFLPLVFLVLYAYQDGNTFRIIPRYVGYAYVFGLVFTAQALLALRRYPAWVRWGLWGTMAVQLVFVAGLIGRVWNDTAPRYFQTYAGPRAPNPHARVAERILNTAQPGDTIVYPSYAEILPGSKAMPSYSVIDAQLVNFYLPKNSRLMQRVDPYERDKVRLVRPTGERIELFDFKGMTYRY